MAPIHFGILVIDYQLIDVAGPIDILGCASHDLFASIYDQGLLGMTEELVNQSVDIKYHHVGETMEAATTTAGLKIYPTTTFDTCPELDYLLIGGPDPFTFKLSEASAKFLQKHVASGKGLFTTCTGGFAIAASGVLDGKTATTNHGILAYARKAAPQVNWVERQWVEDGKLWTAGGACAGMDMMAHWLIENYGMDVAKISFAGLDFEPRDIEGNRVLPQQRGIVNE